MIPNALTDIKSVNYFNINVIFVYFFLFYSEPTAC